MQVLIGGTARRLGGGPGDPIALRFRAPPASPSPFTAPHALAAPSLVPCCVAPQSSRHRRPIQRRAGHPPGVKHGRGWPYRRNTCVVLEGRDLVAILPLREQPAFGALAEHHAKLA